MSPFWLVAVSVCRRSVLLLIVVSPFWFVAVLTIDRTYWSSKSTATLRVCSTAREALGRPRGGEERGMSPRRAGFKVVHLVCFTRKDFFRLYFLKSKLVSVMQMVNQTLNTAAGLKRQKPSSRRQSVFCYFVVRPFLLR